jgi:hypothetical protein
MPEKRWTADSRQAFQQIRHRVEPGATKVRKQRPVMLQYSGNTNHPGSGWVGVTELTRRGFYVSHLSFCFN